MKTIIAAVITCVLLFGASYAASVYFANAPAPEEEISEGGQDETGDDAPMLPPGAAPEKTDLPMQVSNRSDTSPSIEAVLAMSDQIRKDEERLNIEKEIVAKNRKRLDALFEDLKTEQQRLRTMSTNVDEKLERMRQRTDELNAILATIEARRAEVSKMEVAKGADDASKQMELDNKVDGVKEWFSNLAPEQASTYLKGFANNGRLDFAASLLQKMPDRQKAKIIGALSDPVLVEQMVDALNVKSKK